jgi:protein involved in polysaccharide export with SLBB domain
MFGLTIMTFVRSAKCLLALAFMGISLAACATEPLPTGNAAYVVDRGLEYKLGPGDKVRVTVFGEESLSGEFLVANNGAVAFPLIGEVPAGGLTPTAFQAAVQEQLTSSGLVRSPRVTADVVAYRPYYILGEVTKPGQYPYSVGLTVTKAVATAGGFTYRANSKLIYVTREGATREVPVSLTAASAIWPGDTIRIAERHF